MLKVDQVVQHGTDRDSRFRVVSILGRGGFGEAYEVVGVDDDDDDLDVSACLKITSESLAWHGETYFMRLLKGDAHAIQIFDSFPVQIGEGAASRTRFCILMELLRDRTVADVCQTDELPWSEERVARQLRYLLRTLSILHQLQTPHRDITPRNTYVGRRSALKLGDYGIAATARLKAGVRADGIYNPAFRPPDLKTFWDRRDDIYQVGLLGMTLLSGEVQEAGVKKPAVNAVTTKVGVLRDVIKTAIDVKSRRYDHAMAMGDALKMNG